MARVRIGDRELFVLDRGDGPPLLLVHGFPLDHSMWSAQISAFSADFRVIAPDLRGFGQSDVTPGVVGMDRFADDLVAVLDALEVRERVNFCGLSMGGYIAWQFWLRHPSRLERLILCDTRSLADTEEVARGRRAMAERVVQEGSKVIADSMSKKLFSLETHRDQSALVAEARRVMLAASPAGIAAALRGMAERPDVTSQIARIVFPTLVICGEHDEIVPVAEMRELAARIPQARFEIIPGAGHMAPSEQPAVVNALLRGFLVRAKP